ncbi:Uncharacterized protein C8034_v002764 [Colletotrichum sidae]|uniref:ThiJ/PfpI family protein n=1 Tax=Colletotrichum sidae TaxID=1347389 RepID=A0A4R8TBK0_9PEZI|nr:Uncharacterized protein C8034_v002764 [Colletotrichum sidae]
MSESSEMQNPLAWTSAGFTLDDFDVVHIPGGHDSQVRQLLDSASAQNLIADFFPQTKRPGRKIVASICHGPLLLSNARAADGKSVLYDCETTTLPSFFESFIYQGTRVFLGDYYKTYGADSENCEESVRKVLRDPSQLKSSWVPNQPFVVQDPEYNYISARFPGDAERFSEMIVNLALSQS